MNQAQEPLFDPKTYETNPKPPAAFWLAGAVVVSIVVSFLILWNIHDNHAYHGDRPVTTELAQCLSNQLDQFVQTGKRQDPDACRPTMPWYAAHPVPYALAIGGAVFLLGGMIVLLRRTRASG